MPQNCAPFIFSGQYPCTSQLHVGVLSRTPWVPMWHQGIPGAGGKKRKEQSWSRACHEGLYPCRNACSPYRTDHAAVVGMRQEVGGIRGRNSQSWCANHFAFYTKWMCVKCSEHCWYMWPLKICQLWWWWWWWYYYYYYYYMEQKEPTSHLHTHLQDWVCLSLS